MLDSAFMECPRKQFHRFLIQYFSTSDKNRKERTPPLFWGGASGEGYLFHNSPIHIISAYIYRRFG